MSQTWSELSARAGRNDLPAILVHSLIGDRLTDPKEIAVGLEEAWTGCEWPGRAADPEVWLFVFGRVLTGTEYLNETVVAPRSELPETMTLYRGAAPDHALGMSWTSDKDRATWFANRLGAPHGEKVYQIEATPDMVLAKFHQSRGEYEWVLDPDTIDPADLVEVT